MRGRKYNHLSSADHHQSKINLSTYFELNGILATLGRELLIPHISHELDKFVASVKAELGTRFTSETDCAIRNSEEKD